MAAGVVEEETGTDGTDAMGAAGEKKKKIRCSCVYRQMKKKKKRQERTEEEEEKEEVRIAVPCDVVWRLFM